MRSSPTRSIPRSSGSMVASNEAEWHELMRAVVTEGRRVLKPSGSMVVILQPNYEAVGRMRLWPWEFVVLGRSGVEPRAGRVLVGHRRHAAGRDRPQGRPDAAVGEDVRLARPTGLLPQPGQRALDPLGCDLGPPPGRHCHAGREEWEALQEQHDRPGGADERGGTTPFNLLPISTGGQAGGTEGHPSPTPYDVAAWWCRYLLPANGVLLDAFCGSGTMLMAGLDHGASRVIGIDKEANYLETARRRITNS